jgi:ribosome-associated protein
MQSKDPMLDKLLHTLSDMQAIDVKVIDVRGQTSITDHMIICSGRASRHVKAIADQVLMNMKAVGMPALNHNGVASSDWALLDFGDYIVHIMQPECRAFYNLEELWQEKH